nr:ribonuclease H [Ipomoea batatas]
MYTVKAGYKLATGVMSGEGLVFHAWSSLRKLCIPPKYVNFLWRCARAILPVRTTLASRGHTKILWENQLAIQAFDDIVCFEDFLSHLMVSTNPDLMHKVVVLCWSIWTCRNALCAGVPSFKPGKRSSGGLAFVNQTKAEHPTMEKPP